MQLISLLAATAVSLTLMTQAVSLWQQPSHQQKTTLLIASYQSAIRAALAEALDTQQVIEADLPSTDLSIRIRTLAGDRVVAYPDGTVSPGQIRICGSVQDDLISLSSLGRIQLKKETSGC